MVRSLLLQFFLINNTNHIVLLHAEYIIQTSTVLIGSKWTSRLLMATKTNWYEELANPESTEWQDRMCLLA